MKKSKLPASLLEIKTPEEIKNIPEFNSKKFISYSQFALYSNCPYSWKLSYIDKLKPASVSIHMTFGTAMHVTLQTYLTKLYSDGVTAADNLKLYTMLYDQLCSEYKKSVEQNNGLHFSNPTELDEFYNDGLDIIQFFKKERSSYFKTPGFELVGIEVPIFTPSEVNENVYIYGFIDVATFDSVNNKYKLVDIKTSTKGWSKWQKDDFKKIAQLLIYKKYFSRQYNIPIENIDVEYFIVKRKLYENVDFQQKKIQLFAPAAGKINVAKANNMLNEFISKSFTPDGEYNLNHNYQKVLTSHNCKFCVYKGTEHCPESKKL